MDDLRALRIGVRAAGRLHPLGPLLRRVGDAHPQAGAVLGRPRLLLGVGGQAAVQVCAARADVAHYIRSACAAPLLKQHAGLRIGHVVRDIALRSVSSLLDCRLTLDLSGKRLNVGCQPL